MLIAIKQTLLPSRTWVVQIEPPNEFCAPALCDAGISWALCFVPTLTPLRLHPMRSFLLHQGLPNLQIHLATNNRVGSSLRDFIPTSTKNVLIEVSWFRKKRGHMQLLHSKGLIVSPSPCFDGWYSL
mmetsp:Transcript_5529/g.16068  ORF Transcript_5529/g.16068 Transcript_5529/m.16068 type:complete len:127 (-) Transcript_5529:161-541(-)